MEMLGADRPAGAAGAHRRLPAGRVGAAMAGPAVLLHAPAAGRGTDGQHRFAGQSSRAEQLRVSHPAAAGPGFGAERAGRRHSACAALPALVKTPSSKC